MNIGTGKLRMSPRKDRSDPVGGLSTYPANRCPFYLGHRAVVHSRAGIILPNAGGRVKPFSVQPGIGTLSVVNMGSRRTRSKGSFGRKENGTVSLSGRDESNLHSHRQRHWPVKKDDSEAIPL